MHYVKYVMKRMKAYYTFISCKEIQTFKAKIKIIIINVLLGGKIKKLKMNKIGIVFFYLV